MFKNSSLFSQIIIFLKVVEEGSLSAAALKLSVSPSAVSKCLSQLEKNLNKVLIKRDTRSFLLTEEGKKYYLKAKLIHQQVEDFTDEDSGIPDFSGEITVNSSTAFGLAQLSHIIGSFQHQHQQLHCNIIISDQHVDLIKSDTDVAFRITSKTDWKHPAKKLATIRWHYCASPEYIASTPEVSHPLELTAHACLVYPSMSDNGKWLFRDGGAAKAVDVQPAFTSNSSAVLKQLCLQNAGIACLPSYLIADEISAGALKIILPAYQCGYSHDLYAMYYQAKHQSRHVRALINHAAETIGSVPYWDRIIENCRS